MEKTLYHGSQIILERPGYGKGARNEFQSNRPVIPHMTGRWYYQWRILQHALPLLHLDIHEFGTREALLLIKWYGTVKDRLAGDALGADVRRVLRAVGWIERVTLDAVDRDQVEISLKACRHRPHDIFQIKTVDILIDQKYVLQFGKGGKCE